MVRRAVRPDGRSLRDVRRRGAGKASLLDIVSPGAPLPPSLLARFFSNLARLIRRR